MPHIEQRDEHFEVAAENLAQAVSGLVAVHRLGFEAVVIDGFAGVGGDSEKDFGAEASMDSGIVVGIALAVSVVDFVDVALVEKDMLDLSKA